MFLMSHMPRGWQFCKCEGHLSKHSVLARQRKKADWLAWTTVACTRESGQGKHELGFLMNSVVHLQQQNRFKRNFPEIEIGYTKMTSKHSAS